MESREVITDKVCDQLAKKFPTHPKHPERICWGCDKYCPVNDLRCGNGTDRTQHPMELFGENWLEVGLQDSDPPLKTPDNPDQK